jgi:dTDP-4-amino-4,6-dideoxygalactose transaminase
VQPALHARARRRSRGGRLNTGTAAAARVPFGALDADYRDKRAAIDDAVGRVLAKGRFILGEEVRRFEEEFARWLGVGHVVGCASGTEALSLALQASGVGPEQEVLLPANTCVPTIAAVRLARAWPRLADVEPETLTLEGAGARSRLAPPVRCLLPVHLYGGVADIEGLSRLAEAEHLVLVEDCAQSHGATWNGRKTGGFGGAAAFSFYPSKNLGAYGDGGAVATNDAATAERARELRQYGWTRRDHAEREGWNSRLDEIQAAILRAKLPFLDRDNARRLEIAGRYDEAFAGLPLRLLASRSSSVSARHLYPVRIERREEFRAHLASRGIESGVHYPEPIHLQPAYAFLGHARGDFPVAERACETVVSLPIYPALADAQVEAVIAAVRSFFEAP